jgi:hypothetical protein
MTGQEIGPRKAWYFAFCAFSTFFGVIIQASIFGELAVLTTKLSQRSEEFQDKVD